MQRIRLYQYANYFTVIFLKTNKQTNKNKQTVLFNVLQKHIFQININSSTTAHM
jgi:hypothetical protein